MLFSKFITKRLSYLKPLFSFSHKAIKKPNPFIFTDKYEMTQEEIDQILKKKIKKSESVQNIPPINHQSISDSEEKLKKIFAQKLDYEIPDAITPDINKQTPENLNISDQIITKTTDKTPAERKEKYGLPIPNKEMIVDDAYELSIDKKDKEETVNMRIMQVLGVNEETPYETYELELQKKFNFEMDMYGSVVDENEARELQIKKMGDELIPITKINSEPYMNRMRRCFSLNISMPGTLENEHPNKFLKNLRPVEEFRNTPLIPISEKMMEDHKARLERYHRSGVYFEVKKESIANVGIFLLAMYMMYLLLKFVSHKEEEASIAYQRLKIQRIREN